MAKNSVRDFDATAANNTDIQSVNIAEGCAPSGINNAIRELMADMKDVSAGTIALESPQADSMTVTGDLTVDTSTLKVDSTNNRVGILETSPTVPLEIKGAQAFASSASNLSTSTTKAAAKIRGSSDASTALFFGSSTGDAEQYIQSANGAGSAADDILLNPFGGNVGIGVTTANTYSGFTTVTIGGSGDSDLDFERNGTVMGSLFTEASDFDIKATNDLVIQTGGSNDRMRIDSSGNVGLGTSSPARPLSVERDSSSSIISTFKSANTQGAISLQGSGTSSDTAVRIAAEGNEFLVFANGAEGMRLTSGGTLCVDTTGTYLSGADRIVCAGVLAVNSPTYAAGFNVASDGNNIFIMQGGSTEGIISVSGSTVTYGGFTGSHWGRLDDNSKPEILRGTVLETTGNMIDWYRAEFTVTRQETDENGVVSDVTETKSHEIAKPNGVNVGDTFDYVLADDNEWDIPAGTYTATLLQEGDVKHVHTKVSDTSESKSVYGVFGHWDYDCADNVNDMQVASLGTYIVRVNSGETVAIGDLLDSNGDGTAKVQSDDIIRARTVGKVISTVKQETYSDGSYTVPCAIYCG